MANSGCNRSERSELWREWARWRILESAVEMAALSWLMRDAAASAQAAHTARSLAPHVGLADFMVDRLVRDKIRSIAPDRVPMAFEATNAEAI